MKKRIMAALIALTGLAALLGNVAAAPPAAAISNPIAQSWAEHCTTCNLTEIDAQLTFTSPSDQSGAQFTDISHWIGIQNNAGNKLVQAGYDWQSSSANCGVAGTCLFFWYEFTADQFTPTSFNVCAQLTNVCNGYTYGDYLLFKLQHWDSNRWALWITDEGNEVFVPQTYFRYIHDDGKADGYQNPQALVTTEKTTSENLFNDGCCGEVGQAMVVKHPQFTYGGSGYVFSNTSNCCNSSLNMYDDDGDGHELESATTTDTAGYAYHTWLAGT